MSTILTAYQVKNLLGVVIHTSYGDNAAVLAAMKELGVNLFRTDSPQARYRTPGNMYDYLAQNGVKACYMVNGWINPTDTAADNELAAITLMQTEYPGHVAYVEGPNEVNNFPEHYMGYVDSGDVPDATNREATLHFMADLQKNLKAIPCLANVPLINYTDINPAPAPNADINNAHIYEGSWWQDPANTLVASQMQAAAPGKPMASTEWGYPTPSVLNSRSVSRADQAYRITQAAADLIRLQILPHFCYELKDEGTSTTDNEENFGLFDVNWNIKPAGTWYKNFIALLTDTGANAATFTPEPLTVTFSDPAYKYIALPKSDGSYIFAFWKVPAVTPVAENITIHFPKVMDVVNHHLDGSSSWTSTGKDMAWTYVQGLAIMTVK